MAQWPPPLNTPLLIWESRLKELRALHSSVSPRWRRMPAHTWGHHWKISGDVTSRSRENMYITTILLAFLHISSEFEECSAQASRFVSHGYLDFVARRLSIHECRRLSESLHMKRVPLDHPVDGSQEPHLHCVEVINFFRLIQLHYIIGSLKYNYRICPIKRALCGGNDRVCVY